MKHAAVFEKNATRYFIATILPLQCVDFHKNVCVLFLPPPLPLPRQHHPDPVDPELGRPEGGLTNGNHTDTRSARCVETRTPGAASGTMTLRKACHEVAPSTWAACSISHGISRKKAESVQIASGSVKDM